MDGLRLLVTGKTRSGKSTTLHRLITHALTVGGWERVLIFDGKGTELHIYADRAAYFAPGDDWTQPLDEAVADMQQRYKRLAADGLRRAPNDWPHTLIVADEVQTGTRRTGTGGRVKAALSLLFEQSAALGDVLILAAQREIGSVPPTVRLNANARLQMLGRGFFRYVRDGAKPITGQVAINAPLPDDLPLTGENIPAILAPTDATPRHPPVTLYLGTRGAGRTYALKHHPNPHPRSVYIDAAGYGLRDTLLTVLQQCDAIAPTSAPIPDLLAMATIALASTPTLLLIDNLDDAPPKALRNLTTLMEYAAAVAISGQNETPAQQSRLEHLIPRASVVELRPLPRQKAYHLAIQHMPPHLPGHAIDAAEARIWNIARGHPGLTVALARRIQTAAPAELRTLYAPTRRIDAAWVLLLAIIFALVLLRYNLDSATLGAVLLVVLLIARRFLYSALPRKRP